MKQLATRSPASHGRVCAHVGCDTVIAGVRNIHDAALSILLFAVFLFVGQIHAAHLYVVYFLILEIYIFSWQLC